MTSRSRPSGARPRVLLTALSLAPLLTAAWSRAASAQEGFAPPDDDDRLVRASADAGRFVPGVLAPSAGRATMVALAWGGYNGATKAPLVGGSVEARLRVRLVLSIAATYVGASDMQEAALRPTIG